MREQLRLARHVTAALAGAARRAGTTLAGSTGAARAVARHARGTSARGTGRTGARSSGGTRRTGGAEGPSGGGTGDPARRGGATAPAVVAAPVTAGGLRDVLGRLLAALRRTSGRRGRRPLPVLLGSALLGSTLLGTTLLGTTLLGATRGRSRAVRRALVAVRSGRSGRRGGRVPGVLGREPPAQRRFLLVVVERRGPGTGLLGVRTGLGAAPSGGRHDAVLLRGVLVLARGRLARPLGSTLLGSTLLGPGRGLRRPRTAAARVLARPCGPAGRRAGALRWRPALLTLPGTAGGRWRGWRTPVVGPTGVSTFVP
ncbi:hypothetical protein [Saccharopolyspora sp. CA-218241]|uniref:hypothetical protein n=1 Tax=Saccharopolyspora sp. CA-218241 TaxID=3240027 RepID=UPI003D97F760